MKNRKMMRGIVFWTIVTGACFGFITGFTITPITSSIMAILIPAFLGIILFYSNKNRKDDTEELNVLTPAAYAQLKLFGIFILSFTLLAFLAAWLRYSEETKVAKEAEEKTDAYIEVLNVHNSNLEELEKISREFQKRQSVQYEAFPPENQTRPDSAFLKLIEVMIQSQKELTKTILSPSRPGTNTVTQQGQKRVLGLISDTTKRKIESKDNICVHLDEITGMMDSTSSKSYVQELLRLYPYSLEYFINLDMKLQLDNHELMTIIHQFKIDLCD